MEEIAHKSSGITSAIDGICVGQVKLELMTVENGLYYEGL